MTTEKQRDAKRTFTLRLNDRQLTTLEQILDLFAEDDICCEINPDDWEDLMENVLAGCRGNS